MKAKRYTNVNFPHIDGNVQLVWCQSLLISVGYRTFYRCIAYRGDGKSQVISNVWVLSKNPTTANLTLSISSDCPCLSVGDPWRSVLPRAVLPLTRCWRRPWPGCRCCRRRPTPSSRWWRRCSPSASPARWSSSPECRSSAAKNEQKHVM